MSKKTFLFLAILAIPALIITSCKKDEGEDAPTNTPPVASFTVDPQVGSPHIEFNLDATACSDLETPSGELLVRWDLNDDGTFESDYSTAKLGTATFDTPGSYTIRCEVKDGGGLTASATQQITVHDNEPPTAPANPNPVNAAADMPILAGLQWTCDDPDGDPITFDVYFGTSQDPILVSEGQDPNSYQPASMQYSTTYYWKIVAYDDHGHSTEGPLWSFSTSAQSFSCGESLIDTRDGQSYGTVLIGTKCWMAENLNIGSPIDANQDMSDNSIIEKYCFNDNCDTYGGLYQWAEMMQYGKPSQGICPDDWHLPNIEEWQILEMELGMPEGEATASTGWQGSDEGDKLKAGGSSGFNALMGGKRSTNGSIILAGNEADFWSATAASTYNAKSRILDTGHSGVLHSEINKEYGFAVRCIKN
ncbi:MAG: hypothetical protein DRJ15_03850 [Bacteroidetes bacterium]|nr:MAG: hypothetical protein DRJ15_03850 [Bacteroidota bacterium]